MWNNYQLSAHLSCATYEIIIIVIHHFGCLYHSYQLIIYVFLLFTLCAPQAAINSWKMRFLPRSQSSPSLSYEVKREIFFLGFHCMEINWSQYVCVCAQQSWLPNQKECFCARGSSNSRSLVSFSLFVIHTAYTKNRHYHHHQIWLRFICRFAFFALCISLDQRYLW